MTSIRWSGDGRKMEQRTTLLYSVRGGEVSQSQDHPSISYTVYGLLRGTGEPGSGCIMDVKL